MAEFDISKTIGYAVMNLARHMGRNMNTHMSLLCDDVTMQQGAVLYFIANSKNDELIQQDLAEVMNINKSAILRTIDILEKKGFAARTPVCNDRRKNKIEVTPSGLNVVGAFVKSVIQKESDLKKNFTSSEIDSFFKVLTALEKKVRQD